MSECKCTLRETAVGDGCRYCNPQFLIDHLADERDEQAVEIEQLQARVKELEAVQLGLTKTLVEMEARNAELRAELFCNENCTWLDHHVTCSLMTIRASKLHYNKQTMRGKRDGSSSPDTEKEMV